MLRVARAFIFTVSFNTIGLLYLIAPDEVLFPFTSSLAINSTVIIKSELEVNGSEVALDEQITTGLFRILQEVLSNVFLHSQAKSVNVSLNMKKSWLILNVKDNGVGIPDRKIIDKRSVGLFSIQERVRILNGKIKIIGKKNLGTMVTVELPYKWDGNQHD